MGVHFTDTFSLLHLASGIVAYYWGVPFITWFMAHAIFEVAENTRAGMQFIQQFKAWPGGKSHADSVLNSLGDQFYSCVGWGIAYYFTKLFVSFA